MKDESISLSRNRQDVPLCSICNILTEKHDDIFECPQCQRSYDPNREIVAYQDTLRSPHDDEMPEIEGTGGGIDLIADNEDSAISDLYKSQKRLGVRPDENVTYYEEYIPSVDRD